MRDYAKWVDRYGSHEAFEHESFILLRHRRADEALLETVEITTNTVWSHITERNETTFTFRTPGHKPPKIIAPTIVASALLSWLQRLGKQTR
jgi:hypothetical protein